MPVVEISTKVPDKESLTVLFVWGRARGGSGRALQRIVEAINMGFEDHHVRAVPLEVGPGGLFAGTQKKFLAAWSLRLLLVLQFLTHRVANFFSSRLLGLIISLPLARTGLLESVRGVNPDLVVFGWLGTSTVSFEELERLAVPFAVRYSDMWPLLPLAHYCRPMQLGLPDRSEQNRFLARKVSALGKATAFITPSPWLARLHRQRGAYSRSTLEQIPNPIDTAKWSDAAARWDMRQSLGVPKSDFLFFFAVDGRFREHRKGWDLLKSVLYQLDEKCHATGSKLHVVLVGKGASRWHLSALNVHLQPRLHDAQLRDLMATANLCLFPSRQDNSPNLVIESIAVGTPVLAFDHTGLADLIVPDETGFLVRPFDTEAMACRIFDLAQNPDENKRMRLACTAFARANWDYSVVGKKYADFLWRSVESFECTEGD